MGYGDDFMGTALAYQRYIVSGDKIMVGKNGLASNSSVYRNLPFIAHPNANIGPGIRWMEYGSGSRHYVNYPLCTLTAWAWKTVGPLKAGFFRPTPDEARLTIPLGNRPIVFIEPHVKLRASPNKAWLWDRWERVCNLIKRDVYICQFNYGREALPWAWQVKSLNIREATKYLAHADAYCGVEGGLMHAAAAVGVPSVILFGGFISPDVTGYANNVNIFTGDEPCGMKARCDHCTEAMARITAEEVAEHILETVRTGKHDDSRNQAARIPHSQ